MTSPGGSGDRSPAAAPWAVVGDLLDLHERATMLQQTIIVSSERPPPATRRPSTATAETGELMEGMMSSLTSALSALNTGVGGRGGGASSSYGGSRKKKGATVSGGPHRRSTSARACRRRTLSPFVETVATNKLDDGHAWRKYGQKRIHDSQNPRSYYRCTHMPDQGCKARKQVQVSDFNPSEYIISYFGQHTCRDPSTVPLLIVEQAATASTNRANFICFGSGATTTSAHALLPRCQAVDPTMMMLPRFGGYTTSLPAAQERCGGEEAPISGISPFPAGQLDAAVGSKETTTVESAPVYRPSLSEGASDMAGGSIDTSSFPSSPSCLGWFMTGSFGNGVDDDFLFGGFDP